MRSRLQLVSLLFGVALACTAVGKPQVDEEVFEARASMLSMPAVAEGVLVVQTCAECKLLSLQASAGTRYLLGRQAVSLKELSDYVRTHGNAFAALNYDTKTRALNSIAVSVRP